MFYEIREQMKEQKQQLDRNQEQMALDRDNIFQEQEKLRLLNQQLQAHVCPPKQSSTNWGRAPE